MRLRRYLTRLAVGSVILLVACGSSAIAGRHGSAPALSASQKSCRAHYEVWKRGPVRTAARKVLADVITGVAAGRAGDFARLRAVFVRARHDAKAVVAYPMPRCADPARYWHQMLMAIQAGADNVSPGSRLPALVLAATGPLQKVKALDSKLGAELQQEFHGNNY